MIRVLVINRQVPWPLDDGNALRVLELCRHRDADIECHLACLPASMEGYKDLQRLEVFDSLSLLPRGSERRHWRRFFRRDNLNYYRLADPQHFAEVGRTLEHIVHSRKIDVVVAVLERCEEYIRELEGVAKIVDQYDCITLAHERQLSVHDQASWLEKQRWRRRIALAKSVEKGMAQRCDLITAIAPPDVARLQSLNRTDRVERVPNGVSQSILDRTPQNTSLRRGVAFWGNLSFAVNRQAIDHFVTRVWKPYLTAEGVELALIGPHANDHLRALAAENPGIVLAGYVDDLFGYLDQYPVMVNPMVTGGGLKNKVLEAFAAGRAVVSSRLGVDAFPEVTSDHCCIADDPKEQAAAVLRLLDDPMQRQGQVQRARRLVENHYTWRAVGSSWSALLRKLGGVQFR